MASVAGSYTAETLISSVRRRALLPAADDGASFPRDTDILAIVNEEIAGYLAPLVNLARMGHFITHVDMALTSGTNAYDLPARALDADLSTVQLVDANGYPLAPPLVQADLEEAVKYPTYTLGQPLKYYYEGSQIVFLPTPSTSMTARLYYPERPNQLVLVSNTLTITGFPGGASAGKYRIGVGAASPSGFTTSAAGYEVISANPSFRKTSLGVCSAISASTYFEFTGTLPTNIAVGDSLVLQDTANVLTGIPADLFGLIAQWTVVKLTEIRGDDAALTRAEAIFKKEENRVQASLGKRTQLARRKIASGGRMLRLPFYVK